MIWLISKMENFWGTRVTRFVALYAEDRAARLVLWEPKQKTGDFKSWSFAEFPALCAQSCGQRGGRTDGKQKAAVEHPAVNPAAWHEQHAGLESLQQKKALRDEAEGGCGAGEQPGQSELGEVNTEPRRVEPFCAERPLLSYVLCFRETPKCHFPFSPFLLWFFSSSSLPFSFSFPLQPWLQRLFNPQ